MLPACCSTVRPLSHRRHTFRSLLTSSRSHPVHTQIRQKYLRSIRRSGPCNGRGSRAAGQAAPSARPRWPLFYAVTSLSPDLAAPARLAQTDPEPLVRGSPALHTGRDRCRGEPNWRPRATGSCAFTCRCGLVVTVSGRLGRSAARSSGPGGKLGGGVVVVTEHPGTTGPEPWRKRWRIAAVCLASSDANDPGGLPGAVSEQISRRRD